MSVSRRSFFHTVGAGSAVLSAGFIIGRGREAMAFEGAELQPPDDGGFLRIDSNENARGPGRSTIDALQQRDLAARRSRLSTRLRRRPRPPRSRDVRRRAKTSVIVGTGSGPILEAATRAFCAMDKPLVTAAPTFATCEGTARRMGVPVKVIQVDRSLGLDIDGMAAAAKGAGLVFFCNPNNPTGTAHSAATVEKFVRARQAGLARHEDPARRGLHRLRARPDGQDRGAAGAGTAGRVHHAVVLEGARHGGPAPGLRDRSARHRAGDLAARGAWAASTRSPRPPASRRCAT